MTEENQQGKWTVIECIIVAVILLFIALTAWPKIEKLIWAEEVGSLNEASSSKEPSG